MTIHTSRHPLHHRTMPSEAKERCMRLGQREIRMELAHFLAKAGTIETAMSRKCSEPLAVIDLGRGHGWMVPGAGLRVLAGNSIVIRSRTSEFRIFFSGFDQKDRLVCELYMDGKHVRNRRLEPGESLECKKDKEAPFRVTRRVTFGMARCAAISVWADIPKRDVML